jgi:hypothetical protein
MKLGWVGLGYVRFIRVSLCVVAHEGLPSIHLSTESGVMVVRWRRHLNAEAGYLAGSTQWCPP